MLAVILSATGKGASPERIYHGVNFLGNTCGSNALSDKPYNAWVAMPNAAEVDTCDDCFFIKTCLASCNETQSAPEMIDLYPTKDFGYFCVPDTDAFVQGGVQVEFTFSGDFATVQENAARAMGDLYTTWPLILGCAAVALLFSFLYNKLSETFAGVLVTFAIIIILAGGILASYTLIKAGKDARDSNTATNRSNAELGVGITLGVCTIIFLFVIIALRERIRIAIEVVKEANRCVHDIWALIVFPILPMIAGLGYIVFWVVVTVYIFAVWETKEEALPSYITGSTRFSQAATHDQYLPLYNATTGQYMYFSYTWDSSMQRSFAYVFFHLLWTAQFIIYFAYMVMAGTVANWYFAPMDANQKRIVGSNPGELSHTPLSDSCARTCRFHIGTVALAALIIATVQFIRACVKYIEKKCTAAAGGQPNMLQRAVFCLIHCFLYCLQCCLDKINKNALVWTAIWGDSFGTAACSSFKLLWGNLARTGAMSVVSSFLMFLGKVVIALATTGFAGIFLHSHYRDDISSPVLPMVLVFVLAYMVGSLFMSVFEVAMDTVFLCFLIDEKLHAGSGTMCASPGLRKLVDSEEMKSQSAMYAQREHDVQEKRLKSLGMTDDQARNNATGGTGVVGVNPQK